MNETPSTPLRLLRESTGLSLREVARRSGLTPWRLSLIERGVAATAEEKTLILGILAPLVTTP